MENNNIFKILSNRMKDNPEIIYNLTEKLIKASEIGISSRVLNYWKNQGLLLDDMENWKYEHIRFNLIDYVWLNVVNELRSFNVSMKVIKGIKEYLTISLPIEEFTNDIINYYFRTLPEDKKVEYYDIIHDPKFIEEFQNEFTSFEVNFNILSLLIYWVITYKQHISILINKKGEILPFGFDLLDHLLKNAEYKNFIQSTHISISIDEIIKCFIKNANIELVSGKFLLLSDREYQIIKILREEKISELIVHLDKEQTISLIEKTNTSNIIVAESRLLDFMLKDGYQTIELKTQAGKVVYCKATTKIKPD